MTDTIGNLLGGGSGNEPLTEVVTAPPPGEINFGAGARPGPVTIIIPTATNFVLMAVENIVANLRVQQSANLSLPSLYKRAYLVAYQTDEVAVVKP